VIIISPNLGAIGAPQLGHFNDVTPEAAMIDFGAEEDPALALEEAEDWPAAPAWFILVPHL
jgi:hypothetical protein